MIDFFIAAAFGVVLIIAVEGIRHFWPWAKRHPFITYGMAAFVALAFIGWDEQDVATAPAGDAEVTDFDVFQHALDNYGAAEQAEMRRQAEYAARLEAAGRELKKLTAGMNCGEIFQLKKQIGAARDEQWEVAGAAESAFKTARYKAQESGATDDETWGNIDRMKKRAEAESAKATKQSDLESAFSAHPPKDC